MNKAMIWMCLMFSTPVFSVESTCFGTTSNGSLHNAVRLPAKGTNFVGYSSMAAFAGRTYVHSVVRNIVVEAYKELSVAMPKKSFKYAEAGYAKGGAFKPHKTHQNGLSIDFMVPVVDENGYSVHLPTNILNKFGYNIEFDSKSRFKKYRIDYEAMAAHIVALDRSARRKGYRLWRVIFTPEFQANLWATKNSHYLKAHVQFSKKRSWVRHDEHYHVDFEIPCMDM